MSLNGRKALLALALSGIVVGAGQTANAGNFTMVPASAGLMWSNDMNTSLYRYQLSPYGSIMNTGALSIAWWIPVPNSTSRTGGDAWIDLGPGTASASGYAIDDWGNWEASTNVVWANPSLATDQKVTFSAGFQKTSFTYVTYVILMSPNASVNGVEYYEI